MSSKKQTAVVICPGRGTYNKEELGYFKRNHADKAHILECIDAHRAKMQQQSVAELDAMSKYSMKLHTAGENASALIYACAQGDFESINENYEIVAVTGNSMGWYLAMAAAQALNPNNAIKLINTMGSMMTDGVIGGQMLYPVGDQNWHMSDKLINTVENAIAEVNQLPDCEAYDSIYLGAYRVIGANEKAIKELEKRLPNIDNLYPMRLFNHAAFHTPLLQQTSDKAFALLEQCLFDKPKLPLIDGRGHIWQPMSTDTTALRDYTLGEQVTQAYDFSAAIEVAVKEFAPDKLIITGPGTTLGGAVAQSLIQQHWLDLQSKSDFIAMQKSDPFVLAMGIPEQRELVV